MAKVKVDLPDEVVVRLDEVGYDLRLGAAELVAVIVRNSEILRAFEVAGEAKCELIDALIKYHPRS